MLLELGKKIPVIKSGMESFHVDGKPLEFNLQEFWRWSVSDLLSNVTRGCLAEYIVAKALNINMDKPRNEWDAFDLVSPEDIKVEVKSAAYLQSWRQEELSIITFRVPQTRYWDADTGVMHEEAKRQADVYVFALLAHTDKTTVDPMNVNQWQFYVLPTSELNSRKRSQHSITLKSLEKLTDPLSFLEISEAVRIASKKIIKIDHDCLETRSKIVFWNALAREVSCCCLLMVVAN